MLVQDHVPHVIMVCLVLLVIHYGQLQQLLIPLLDIATVINQDTLPVFYIVLLQLTLLITLLVYNNLWDKNVIHHMSGVLKLFLLQV